MKKALSISAIGLALLGCTATAQEQSPPVEPVPSQAAPSQTVSSQTVAAEPVAAAPAPTKPAETPPAPPSVEEMAGYNWSQDKAVQQAANYFNSIRTLKARFEQIAPSGSFSDGVLYIQRPGRARFEYETGSPITLIAAGPWITLHDREFDTVDRYPISSTPLGLILNDELPLTERAEILSFEQGPEIVRLKARDRDEPGLGSVTFVFAKQPFELRQWVVDDAQGGRTRVMFSGLTYDVKLDPALFHISDRIGQDKR